MNDFRGRLEAILKDITYKPGWKFQVLPPDLERYYNTHLDPIILYGVMMVPSLDQPGHPLVPIQFAKTLTEWACSDMTDADIILHLISGFIREMELHEMDEWLKYRGYHVHDPHPEHKKTTVENFLVAATTASR